MNSIQTKFIILILGCVFLSSVVIGGAGILNSERVVDEDSITIMNLHCGAKAQSINALLSRIEQSVNTLAVYSIGQLGDVEALKTNDAYAEEYTNRIKAVAINAANNTEGALAVYLRFNPEFSKPTSGLFWSKTALNGSFQELVPTDFSKYSPEDIEHVGWYYLPVKKGKATWMAPYMNQNINVQMISYVIPLYVDNVTVGVIGMDIDFEVIKEIVKQTRVYDSGYAFLTDMQANVLYHKEIASGTALGNVENSLRPVADELKSGGGGSFLFPYTWRGQEKKMALGSLNNGMRLAVTAPTTEIDTAKNRLIWQICAAVLLIGLISVAVTVAMTRRLIRPLRELNAAAQKIAAGDLSVSLIHQTKDEVGTLADSFQQTVNHLRKYIDYINGLAYRDGLTGVKNKTAYQEVANRIEEETRLGRPEFAVIVLDINNLKMVNDTHGHDFGDMLLIDACKIICKVFKRSPVFRIGGDEFVIILENADFGRYSELLDRFQREMEEYNQTARPDSQISIARGIAIYEENADLSFNDVFKRADDAMYQNKAAMKEHAGENRGEDAGGKPLV